MSYSTYTIPPTTGVTMAFGGGTMQSIWDGVLSYAGPAQALATAIGASVKNAATSSELGGKFAGLGSTDPQPWVVQFPSGAWYFAGVSINQQVEANEKVMGVRTAEYPGDWKPQPDGSLLWVPKPLIVAPPAPTPAAPGADAATWANSVMNAGQGYLAGDRQTLLETHRLLVALAAKAGII